MALVIPRIAAVERGELQRWLWQDPTRPEI
jgi:hypothetical protein